MFSLFVVRCKWTSRYTWSSRSLHLHILLTETRHTISAYRQEDPVEEDGVLLRTPRHDRRLEERTAYVSTDELRRHPKVLPGDVRVNSLHSLPTATTAQRLPDDLQSTGGTQRSTDPTRRVGQGDLHRGGRVSRRHSV